MTTKTNNARKRKRGADVSSSERVRRRLYAKILQRNVELQLALEKLCASKRPFKLNQIIRHKVTGDIACVTAVDGEVIRAEPTTTAHFLYPPYEGWEAV